MSYDFKISVKKHGPLKKAFFRGPWKKKINGILLDSYFENEYLCVRVIFIKHLIGIYLFYKR